eukprot:5885287-Pyramimonas_sp.AAC.1
MRLAMRVDKMDEGFTSLRVSTPSQVRLASTITLTVIGITVQATITGVTMQIDFERWCHHFMDDLIRAGLLLPGHRVKSSRWHAGRFFDTVQ